MSEFLKTYTPKPCEGDDAQFSGEVVLILPNNDQRMDLFIDNADFFEQDESIENKDKRKQILKKSKALCNWSYQFYKKVDIKRKSDNYHFKSLEELQASSDCSLIIADIANRLSLGFELGN